MRQTLIKGGRLIDGKGGDPIDKGALLIEGRVIIRVGKAEEFQG